MTSDCRNIETILVHGNKGYDETTGAVSFPIYQSATFRHKGLNMSTGYDYSRTQNPTREELENTIAKLEVGRECLAFSCGMAAVDAVVRLFLPKEHIIISDDLYGGTYRLFEEIYKNYGIETSYVDTRSVQNIKNAIKPNTKGIFIETPSNPTMKVTDIEAVTAIAKAAGLISVVDNTFLSPYFQNPLKLGADIVIHSGTKFLSGHNDTLAGFVIANEEDIIERLRLIQRTTGSVLSPFDSWLTLRGIKTLAVRLDKQQQNALKLAEWLSENKAVDKVYYPGLPAHENYKISVKQATGFGSMISFTVKSTESVKRALEAVEAIMFAESLGGVESLITYPYIQTHASIPEERREKMGITDKLLRLSVGIENIEDLIKDLDKALNNYSI